MTPQLARTASADEIAERLLTGDRLALAASDCAPREPNAFT